MESSVDQGSKKYQYLLPIKAKINPKQNKTNTKQKGKKTTANKLKMVECIKILFISIYSEILTYPVCAKICTR